MGGVNYSDEEKLQAAVNTAPAEPAPAAETPAAEQPAGHVLPDFQVDVPVEIVDAAGVTTPVTAKVTITPALLHVLVGGMVAVLDALETRLGGE